MNNLSLQGHRSIPLLSSLADRAQGSSSADHVWSSIAEDKESGYRYIACHSTVHADDDATSVLSILRFGSADKPLCREDVTEIAQIPVQDASVRVVGFAYIPDEQALWTVFSSGEVILLGSLDESVSVEEVGNFSDGILDVQQSPDDELAVFVTGTDPLAVSNAV